MKKKAVDIEQRKFERKLILTRQIALMCALDGTPFAIVESTGFQTFCKSNGIEDLPTASAVSGAGLRDVFLFAEGEVKRIISSPGLPNSVAISFDCATDRFVKRAYINIKLHYCDTGDFTNKVINLTTMTLPRPHTGANIADIVRATLSKFNLLSKQIIAVTDGGSNVKLACKLLDFERHGCILHSLHLLIAVDLMKHSSMKPLVLLVNKLKIIYRALTYKYERLLEVHDQSQTQRNLQKIGELMLEMGE
jgi:hypothetical protein